MNFDKIKIMYFLGIGGIGMSALARYFNSLGVEIYGYDLTPSKLTSQLIDEGMKIHFTDDVSQIPSKIDLVVYTPAVPKSHSELNYFQKNSFEIVKRSQLLGMLSHEFFTIAVAGTHGKTSISSMIAHLLFSANKNVTALIGGIMNNVSSNAIISKSTDYLVLEADEFDRSFHWLEPNISVVSSMDDDHLDIYNNSFAVTQAFVDFANKTADDGLLVYNENLSILKELNKRKRDYGFDLNSNIVAKNVKVVDANFVFDLHTTTKKILNIKIQIPGRHYINNALAAAGVCLELGLTEDEIKTGLESFKGVERRFEYRCRLKNSVYIDDYAHHPKEISSTIEAVKELYPNKKLTVVFQPHLFSRTRDFVDGFASTLQVADEIILLDIYPARELPMVGITSKLIYDKIENKHKYLMLKDEMLKHLTNSKPEIVLSLGAGDIGLLVDKIQNIMEKNG